MRRWILPHLGIVLVLAVALATRLIYLRWFKTFPPGDVFNFINIARGLPDGYYPPTEKRLPFFPFLLLLLRPFLDWEPAGLVIAVGASLLALVALYALGRAFGFPKTALAAALLVFQLQPQFFLASTRAYADTTFIALALFALLALIQTRAWRGAAVTGALLGCAALTRYEGGTLAALVLPMWLLFPRLLPSTATAEQRRLALVALGTFLVTLVPYALVASANNRPIVGAGYVAEAAVEANRGAPGLAPFLNQLQDIGERTGLLGAWNIPGGVLTKIGEDPFGTPRILAQRLIEPNEFLAVLGLIGSVALFFWRQWRVVLLLFMMVLAVAVPAAWYQPLARYDAFVYPVATLLWTAGFGVFQRLVCRGTVGQTGHGVRILATGILFAFVGGFWLPHGAEDIRDRQLKHNGRSYAFYQAIHAARSLTGRIGFTTDADIVRIYFPERWYSIPRTPPSEETPAAFTTRLRQEEGLTHVVLPSRGLGEIRSLGPAQLETIAEFAWPQVNDEWNYATVYRLR